MQPYPSSKSLGILISLVLYLKSTRKEQRVYILHTTLRIEEPVQNYVNCSACILRLIFKHNMTVLMHYVLDFCVIVTLANFVVCAPSPKSNVTMTQIFNISSTIKYEFIHVKAVGDKPTLLFLHGFPSSLHSWRHQTKHFSNQGYGCLVPNLIGYGNTSSPLNEAEYSSKLIIGHLIALLNNVTSNNSEVFVIGHDWGSQTASRFVLYHPERTIGAILLSVAYGAPGQFNLDAALNQSEAVNGYASIGY